MSPLSRAVGGGHGTNRIRAVDTELTIKRRQKRLLKQNKKNTKLSWCLNPGLLER